MRLRYERGNLDVEISDSSYQMCILSIENREIMSDFLENIWSGANGLDGTVFFSEGTEFINLSKKVAYVTNPLSLSNNDRKILNHLYLKLQDISIREEFEQLSELNKNIVTFLDNICERLPYPITFNLETDLMALFKGFGIAFEEDVGLLERVTDYIRLSHQILGTQLFIFYHLYDFFDDEQIKLLEEMINYEQVTVLLVESSLNSRVEGIKYVIIDNDNCLIEY